MKQIPIHRLYNLIPIGLSLIIPWLVYELIKNFSGYAGGTAITSTLKTIGFRISMESGIRVLLILCCLCYSMVQYIRIIIYKDLVEKDIRKLKLNSVASILNHIETYNVSTPLKTILKSNYL